MRPDMDDLKFVKHRAMDFAPDSDELRVEVLRAIGHGSKERSPFLHTSTSLIKAHRWAQLAHVERQEEARSQVMVRIDVWAWYQSGKMAEDMMVDLSTLKAQ